MENCNEPTFVLTGTMEEIYGDNSDLAGAMALLREIDDYIRMYGVCSIIDLAQFGVDIRKIYDKTTWTFCENWGWTASQMDGTGVVQRFPGVCVIRLGKAVDLHLIEEEEDLEMKITNVVQQPEPKNKSDCFSCSGCQYLCASTFDEPCRSCINACNFTPRKESKGENKMNYTTTLEAAKMLNSLKSPYANRNSAVYASEQHGIDPDALTPYRIWFNSHDTLFFTTVQWMDDTKTTVAIPEDEHATEYSGFTAALAKKIFGTTGALKSMESAVEKAKEPAKRKAAQREATKYARQHAHELRMKAREDRIQCEMEQMRIKREAQRRLDAEELNEAVPKALGKIRKALKGGKK